MGRESLDYLEFLDEPKLSYALRVDLMQEFFENHPEYKLIDFEPITGGIRAYYLMSQHLPGAVGTN